MSEQQTFALSGDSGNRAVQMLLAFGSTMEIESTFGLSQLHQYLNELQLLQMNVPFAELGIGKRREASQPAVLINTGNSYQLVSDRGLIKNERLTPPGSIALMRLNGVMTTEDQLSTRGIQTFAGDMRDAYANKNIAAVGIEMNSGGGQSTAKDMMVSVLSERNKPVLSFVHYAASAAYGTAAATDEIIAASPESQVGSVGAVITLDKVLLEEIKNNFIQIFGDNAPDKSEEFRAALEGDFSKMQALANNYTDAFQAEVAKFRPLTGDAAYQRKTLQGGMFSSKEAKKRGLIDGVGNMDYVINRAEKWVKIYNKAKA